LPVTYPQNWNYDYFIYAWVDGSTLP